MSDQTLQESVESLADFVEEMYEGCAPSRGCTGCEALLKVQAVRAALAAARPFMTSRPALGREALFRLLHEQGCGCDLTAEPHTVGYTDWLPSHRAQYEERADSVMALAVPVPTEEEIAEALATSGREVWPATPAWADMAHSGRETYYRSARAVLALLNGSAK